MEKEHNTNTLLVTEWNLSNNVNAPFTKKLQMLESTNAKAMMTQLQKGMWV